MTPYIFKKLVPSYQLLLVNLKGIKLDHRRDGDYHVALFQVEGFYVEAYYHNKSYKVEKLIAFQNTNKLKPYLEHIDISDIFIM